MKFEEYEATIAQDFVCAIEYGDMSGLENKKEERQVKAWLKQWPSASFQYGDQPYFGRCDICGLMADCIDVTIFVPVHEEAH